MLIRPTHDAASGHQYGGNPIEPCAVTFLNGEKPRLKLMAFVKASIKRSLGYLWPADLVNQILFETQSSAKHFKSWLLHRSKFRGKKDLKLNVGCGANVASGYINVDLDGPEEVFRWDCRRGLPFDDNSTAFIFAEHVFEHLDADSGARFLLECKRCLHAGGIVRIVVPDAGRYLELYRGDWSGFVPVRPLTEEGGKYRDIWLNKVYRTKMEFINEVFRQGAEHKYAYDGDTLIMRLKDAGFTQVIRQSYGVSIRNEAPLDTEARSYESLYVEGVK
jgi:predicted SAM-dependent methyltransferase